MIPITLITRSVLIDCAEELTEKLWQYSAGGKEDQGNIEGSKSVGCSMHLETKITSENCTIVDCKDKISTRKMHHKLPSLHLPERPFPSFGQLAPKTVRTQCYKALEIR